MSGAIQEYDVIIIGAGAGGGVAAGVLAEAGKRVLLLERGRAMGWRDDPIDHLRNHRLAAYGHNTGPDIDGNPRVYVDLAGNATVVRPHEGGYNNNASAVGGGTLVFGAQAWRFMPQDFRMASIYGSPEGSSLADWPIEYADLEKYYDRAENELGVAGLPSRFAGPRQRPYPMPPVPDNPQRKLLGDAARSLGWETIPVPVLINTTQYNGRPPCAQCGNCVGHICPSNSKNGTQNTMTPRALTTGNCTLQTGVFVRRIDTDQRGKVVGVSYIQQLGDQAIERTARAQAVISSAGAIETARLFLNSASDHHPHGLGNHSDHVGRHLQGHYYPSALGRFAQSTYDGLGPGVSIATVQFNHGNPGIVGGGMLANEFIKTPVIFNRVGSVPPSVQRWGLANKQYMREYFTRSVHITGPVQDVPSPTARVTIDPDVRDKYNIPVARLSGATHPETLKIAEFMRQKAIQWMTTAGALEVWSFPIGLYLSGGQHQAGTCRMGRDPATSVTDGNGKVHGHENLFVADGSLNVTNGGFNPVLTILALAFKVAEHVATIL